MDQILRERRKRKSLNTNLIIFGPPGAGKGTYASRLATILNIASIATGDIFREEIKHNTTLGKKVVQFVNSGVLVPDDIVVGVLGKKLKKPNSKRGFILDGYPRTVQQAKALEKLAKIDAVVLLILPTWIIVERLSSRRICSNCGEVYNIRYLKPKIAGVCDKCGGKLYQREDDKPDVIKERLKVYERQTQPLIEHYKQKVPIIKIHNRQIDTPPGTIIKKIMNKLKKASIIRSD